jgi:hypothetical protein
MLSQDNLAVEKSGDREVEKPDSQTIFVLLDV